MTYKSFGRTVSSAASNSERLRPSSSKLIPLIKTSRDLKTAKAPV